MMATLNMIKAMPPMITATSNKKLLINPNPIPTSSMGIQNDNILENANLVSNVGGTI
jgi:hypothetical protein